MMWKFINFQLKKWREYVKSQIPKKKITNTKNKRTKKEPNRGQWCNIFFQLFLGQMLLYQMYQLISFLSVKEQNHLSPDVQRI